MKRRCTTRTLPGVIALLLPLAVLGYNLWAVCCGRCTARTFLTLGPPGAILLALLALGSLMLVALRWRRCRLEARHRCSCGVRLAAGWDFCPDCGIVVRPPSP